MVDRGVPPATTRLIADETRLSSVCACDCTATPSELTRDRTAGTDERDRRGEEGALDRVEEPVL